jgi:kynureninase
MILSREGEAHDLDARDPLAHLRGRFVVPVGPGGREMVYLCGNSLGLLPAAARAAVDGVLDAWGRLGVDGHFQGETPW